MFQVKSWARKGTKELQEVKELKRTLVPETLEEARETRVRHEANKLYKSEGPQLGRDTNREATLYSSPSSEDTDSEEDSAQVHVVQHGLRVSTRRFLIVVSSQMLLLWLILAAVTASLHVALGPHSGSQLRKVADDYCAQFLSCLAFVAALAAFLTVHKRQSSRPLKWSLMLAQYFAGLVPLVLLHYAPQETPDEVHYAEALSLAVLAAIWMTGLVIGKVLLTILSLNVYS